MSNATSEVITKEYLDARINEAVSKAISKESIKELDGPDSRPVTRDYLKSEIKDSKFDILKWMFAMFIAFAALISVFLDARIDDIGQRITTIEVSLNRRMDSFEKRMDSFEKRMDSFERKLDSLEKRMDSIEKGIVDNRILIQKVLDHQARQ